MNFPNVLTIIRILIALVAPFFLIEGDAFVRGVIGLVIFIAFLTDWLDGWYARKFNLVTTLGKILDPIADKALILVSFSVFAYLDVISVWWIIPIFIREIVITVYRFIFLSKNVVVAAAKSGKIKTVMQMITLGLTYFLFMMSKHFRDYFSEHYRLVLYLALILTLYFTVKSGVLFFIKNWRHIKSFHEIA